MLHFSLGAGLFDWKVRGVATALGNAFAAYNKRLQADMRLLTNGDGSGTVIRVLQQKLGSEHGAYEWLPLRYGCIAQCDMRSCFHVTRGCRWFKWLHASHPCSASKAWASSQGLDVGEAPRVGDAEGEGGSACVVS